MLKRLLRVHINTTSQLPKEITRDVHIIGGYGPHRYAHNANSNTIRLWEQNPTENTRFIRYYDRALTDLQIFNLAEKKDIVYAPLLKIPKQLGTLKNPTTLSANPAVVNKKYFEYNQGLTHDFQLGNMCSINSGTLTFPSGQTCTVNENYVTFKNEYARFHNTLNDTSTAQPIEIPGSQIGHLLDDITFEICFKIPPRPQQAGKYRILEIGDFTSGTNYRLGLWAERDGNKNVIIARVFSEGNGTGSANANMSQDKTLAVESGGSMNPNCVNHLTDSRSFNIETGGFGYGTMPNDAGSMLLSHGWQHLVISFGSIDKTGDRRHFSMFLKGRRASNGMDYRQEDSDTVLIDYGPFFEKMSYNTSNTNYKMVLGSHVSRWEYSPTDTNHTYGWHYHGNEDGYTSTIDIKFVKIYNGISMATNSNLSSDYSDASLQRTFYDNYILENRNTTGDAVFFSLFKGK